MIFMSIGSVQTDGHGYRSSIAVCAISICAKEWRNRREKPKTMPVSPTTHKRRPNDMLGGRTQ